MYAYVITYAPLSEEKCRLEIANKNKKTLKCLVDLHYLTKCP
jgi:hypothetical protein